MLVEVEDSGEIEHCPNDKQRVRNTRLRKVGIISSTPNNWSKVVNTVCIHIHSVPGWRFVNASDKIGM